ncbi:MAG: ArsR family transcriptional regulator [Anaeromyxobacter sp.]
MLRGARPHERASLESQGAPRFDELPLAQSTASQHLKVLKDAGLIRGDIDGPRVCCYIESRTLRRLESLVGSLQETTSTCPSPEPQPLRPPPVSLGASRSWTGT